MSILFPSGSTCEVYEYGYQSGCTDDQGVTRGFTQGWYFDGAVQAWISTSNELKDGATGPAGSITFDAVVTQPYSFVSNTPDFDGTDRTGDLRKFLFLQEDGSITTDYIKFHDVLDPFDQTLNVESITWNSLTAMDAEGSSDFDPAHSLTGVTLCAPTTFVYDFGEVATDGNSDSTIVTISVANNPLSLAPDTKGLTLSVDATAGPGGLNSTYVSDLGSLAGSAALPFSVTSPVKGSNTFSEQDGSNAVKIGISAGAGGPKRQLARLKVEATAGADIRAIGTNERTSTYLSTENYVYFFASTGDMVSGGDTDQGGGVTGPRFLELAAGPSGGKFLLPSDSDNANHSIGSSSTGQNITGDDFGNASSSPAAFLYICAPSRVNIRNTSHLFYDKNNLTPYGFRRGVTTDHENRYGYSEKYLIYRTENAIGVLPQGIIVKGPGNS